MKIFMGILATVILAVVLVSCVRSMMYDGDGINPRVRSHFNATEQYSYTADWRGARSGQFIASGVVLNAIPVLHFAGVWIDTFFVWWGTDRTIMGVGAIIANQRDCLHLLQPEDALLVKAIWTEAASTNTISRLFAAAANVTEITRNASGLTMLPREAV